MLMLMDASSEQIKKTLRALGHRILGSIELPIASLKPVRIDLINTASCLRYSVVQIRLGAQILVQAELFFYRLEEFVAGY
jgi:hypothetical protein